MTRVVIQLRVSVEEKVAWELSAKSSGVTLTQLIRGAMCKEVISALGDRVDTAANEAFVAGAADVSGLLEVPDVVDAAAVEKLYDLLINCAVAAVKESEADTFDRRKAFEAGKAEGLHWAAQHLKTMLEHTG